MESIRDLRKAKGLTQKQLAKLIDVTESQVSQIETGKRNPSFETLLKLGEVFGCSVDDIVRNKKIPTTTKDDGNEDTNNSIMSEEDRRVLAWYYSQSEETRKLILSFQDAQGTKP